MVKSISFLPQFIPQIKSGKKTVTRRVKTNLKAGDICYFKVGRLGRKRGYLKICNTTMVRLRDVEENILELEREGMRCDIKPHKGYWTKLNEFTEIWDRLNKNEYKFENNPLIYRIKFKYLGESLSEKQN